MPIYLSTKQDLSIPKESDSDLSSDEMFLTDPEKLYDRLPQPFHLISKILNKILNEVYLKIDENVEKQLAESYMTPAQDISHVSLLENVGIIQSMAGISSESNQIVVGLNDGLVVIDMVTTEIVDRWESSDFDVISVKSEKLCDNIFMLTVIDNSGNGRLVALAHNRLYGVKIFAGSKDNADKPSQVTSITMDETCGYVAVSFDYFKDNDQSLEVHKINRDAWIKEIGLASKAFQEQIAKSDSQLTDNFPANDESSSVLDRNGLRTSATIPVLKIKCPDLLASTGLTNFTQLYKQIDTTGGIIGIGLNHCLPPYYMEKISNVFDKDIAEVNGLLAASLSESHIMRIANVRFSKLAGSMIRDVSRHEGSDKESSITFVWWSQMPHLFIYGLHKVNQKTTGESLAKPDAIRSFSCPISCCEVSPNDLFLTIGLQNGIIILIDILSGLTKTTKMISDNAIQSIHFLHFENDSSETKELSHDFRINKSTICLSLVDVIGRMFHLTYDPSTLSNDSTCLQISNDYDVDSVTRLDKNCDFALTVSQRHGVIIRDMVSGMKLMKIQLPDSTYLASPWQPIFGFSSKSGYLCLQVLLNQGEETEDVERTESLNVIYNLQLESQQESPKLEAFNKECKLLEPGSYMYDTAENILLERRLLHSERQTALQESWENLDNILKSLS